MITNYQLSEITLGSLYFVFIYMIGSYIINGGINMRDILTTSVIFAIWSFLTKIIPNYLQFMKHNK